MGTIAGQACAVAVLPVVSRHFSPEEMGYFSSMVAAISVVAPVVCLHYELAIPLQRSDRAASGLLHLSLGMSVVVALLGSVILIKGASLMFGESASIITSHWYLFPIVLLLTGINSSLLMRTIRTQQHGRNAASKFSQGAAQAAVQGAAALGGSGWSVLVWGQMTGLAAGILPLLYSKQTRSSAFSDRESWRHLTSLLRRYRRFPLLAVPSTLVNSAAVNVPIIMLGAMFGGGVAGLFGLGFRVLQLPTRLVGQAVSQVILARSPNALRDNNLGESVSEVSRVLLVAGLHTFLPLMFTAPALFAFIFGDKWREAGLFVQFLAPWIFAGFLATPLSMLVTVLGKQKQELLLQTAYLLVIVLALTVGWIAASVRSALILLGLCGSVFLFIKVIWLMHISACDLKRDLARFGVEFGIALFIHSPLAVMAVMGTDDRMVTAVSIAWILGAHAFNHFRRRAYAF
ncbi:MAG: lipopolysaccharide biosynthesis protein [bacterium]|nr:lipopolysaccharide biosynthesis protein [bacterium]